MDRMPFLVRVSCMTYNHAPYIVDAMNGFTIQQTNFPFVCTIIDDASTDGEPEIISKYLLDFFELKGNTYRKEETDDYILTFARHKANTNCYFAVIFLKYNHYSIKKAKSPYIVEWNNVKYIAPCEGDDYWIDSQKLQKQVDFLNSNQDYSMCFHKADVIIESGDYSGYDNSMYDDLEEREYSGIELASKWRVPTASIMYRSNIRPPQDKKLLTGDIPLVLQCAMEGRVFCLADQMSVYRRTSGGVTLNKYTTLQMVDKMLAYIRCFPPFKSVYKNVLITMMQTMIYSSHCYEAIKLVVQRKKIFFYFVAGLTKGLIQMPQRIINKILK